MSDRDGQIAEDCLDPKPAAAAGGARKPRWRRRRFLVNRRYQFRVAALTVTLALVLLVFLNLSLYSSNVQSSREIIQMAPEFESYIKSQDRSMVRLVLLGSLVFLVGVFLVGILESHKTAGAAVNLSMRLEDLTRGRYNVGLRLRKGDNLRDLEEPFNRMCEALRQRERDEIETLERIAEEAEAATGDCRSLGVELRRMAESKRDHLS